MRVEKRRQEPTHSGTRRSIRTLFIGGVGRSGTTILELSLGTDPRVVSLGEVVHLWERCLIWNEACACGRVFSECPFWVAVGKRAFGGWAQVDAERVLHLKRTYDRAIRTPQIALRVGGRQWRAELAEYASYYVALYAAAADVSGAEVVVDSSKQASLPHILRLDRRLDLSVLHCVRDSRAVAYSWTRTVARPEAQGGRRTSMPQFAPRVVASAWVRQNLVIDALRVLGVPTMRMRYEDWVTGPDAALERVLAFAGLEPRPNEHVGPDWVEIPAAHTCSGNPMRFTRGRVQVRHDNEWVRGLAGPSRRLVTAITGPLLAGYGYWRSTS